MSGEHTIIRGGRVLRADSSTPFQDILIAGGTIIGIGQPGLEAPESARQIDARHRLIHPGLISAHTHGHCNFAKGHGDRWTLELLQTAGPWIGAGFTLEERYLVTYVGALEMLTKGCTACYDMTAELPAPTVEGLKISAQAYVDAGMRAVVAPMVAEYSFFQSIPGLLEALPQKLRLQVDRFNLEPVGATLGAVSGALREWTADREMVCLGMAPTIPHHCSDEFMMACVRLAREHGLRVQTHIQESKVQVIASLRKYGKTQIAHLDEIGYLGPDFTAGHGVWLDDDDMRRLADNGCSVSVNPGSNMRLGNGLPDARRMLDFGLNIGIGTDGAHCSDNLNMFEAMRVASYASKVQGPDTERWLTTGEVLHAATAGSAKALGFGDNIGRIDIGRKADLVFLKLNHPNWMPFNNAVNQMVHTEDGSAIAAVMVDGRIVVENGVPIGVDLVHLMERVEGARQRLAEQNTSTRELCQRLAVVVNSFCPTLARMPYHINRYGCGHHAH